MNIKTIWIINQYASSPSTGYAGRHYYLARELAQQGYRVYLIAACYTHLLRQEPEMTSDVTLHHLDGFHMVWLQMPRYSNAHSKKRVGNWFRFCWKLRTLPRFITDTPDVILYSSPSPVGFMGAKYLAEKYEVPLIFEVRDIWPLTLIQVGGYSRNHPFMYLLQWIEDRAYQSSNCVVSNLNNAVEHMVNRGMNRDKFSWIPNGFSMDEVSQNVALNAQAESQLPSDKFIVGYTGTIGVANSLDTLIQAAEKLREYAQIAFVLVGDGKEKKTLQQSVKEKDLSNVFFIEPIPKVEIQAMLAKFDVCYLGWLNNPLYRFGIGANKIPEYLYSAKPVIHAYSGECDPIESAGAGIRTPAEDSEKLAEAILKLYHMPADERAEMGANGRKVALEEYEYTQLAEKLSRVLFE